MNVNGHQRFGLPAGVRFYLEDEGGGGGGSDAPATETALGGALDEIIPSSTQPAEPQERMEGEKLPDFGSLGKRKPPTETPAKPPETPEGGKETPEPEKRATEAPAKKPTPQKTPPKQAKQPEKPEPPKKEDPKPPEEPKKTEKGKKELTEEEIDLMELPAAASEAQKSNFSNLKKIAKEAVRDAKAAKAEAEAIRKEAATLKTQVGKVPDEVNKELEDLRAFRLAFDAENMPAFQQEYAAKVKSSEDNVRALLKRHGLKPEVIAEFEAATEEAGGDMEAWERWGEVIKAFANPVDQQEMLDALKARRDAIASKSQKLQQLSGKREEIIKQIDEKQIAERKGWAKQVEQEAIKLTAGLEWMQEEEIPADATPEQREAIEAANAQVAEHAKKFAKHVMDAYNRKPNETAEIAIKAVQAEKLIEELEAVTKELEKTKALLRDREMQFAKVKNAGRISDITPTPPPNEVKEEKETKIGGDGESAIKNYPWKGRR